MKRVHFLNANFVFPCKQRGLKAFTNIARFNFCGKIKHIQNLYVRLYFKLYMKMFTISDSSIKNAQPKDIIRAFVRSYILFLVVIFALGMGGYLLFEDEFEVLFLFIFYFIAAFALGGFLVSFFIRNFRHVESLNERLGEAIDETNRLSATVEAEGPALFQSRVNKILAGSIISPDEAAYTRTKLGLTNENLSYYILYCVTYGNDFIGNPAENITYDENIRSTFNSFLLGKLKEAFSFNDNLYYYYAPTSRTYSVIVPFEGGSSEIIIEIQEKILAIHKEILEKFNLWFFAGLGEPCKYEKMWESFEQARQMAGKAGRDYIFSPYEVSEKDSRSYFYPTEFANQLTHFIADGKKDQVKDLFAMIIKENIQERSLSVQLTKYLISDVRNSILRARFAVNSISSDQGKLLFDIDHILAGDMLTFSLLEDCALKLCEFSSAKKTDSNQMDTIVAYIADNFTDPSMGLNMISDKFNISESYFSHMFKEAMGINFSVYLEDMRLKEASHMIEAKEGSLSDIAEAVGYNSIASFRRAFKKKYGVTPGSLA